MFLTLFFIYKVALVSLLLGLLAIPLSSSRVYLHVQGYVIFTFITIRLHVILLRSSSNCYICTQPHFPTAHCLFIWQAASISIALNVFSSEEKNTKTMSSEWNIFVFQRLCSHCDTWIGETPRSSIIWTNFWWLAGFVMGALHFQLFLYLWLSLWLSFSFYHICI